MLMTVRCFAGECRASLRSTVDSLPRPTCSIPWSDRACPRSEGELFSQWEITSSLQSLSRYFAIGSVALMAGIYNIALVSSMADGASISFIQMVTVSVLLATKVRLLISDHQPPLRNLNCPLVRSTRYALTMYNIMYAEI